MEAKGYTRDGTVDLHGRPVLATKTGKWKACAFLVGNHILILLSSPSFIRRILSNVSLLLHEDSRNLCIYIY